MSARRIVGLILVILGCVALLTGGFGFTRQKTVLDAGPIEIKADDHERVSIPPVLGIVVLIGGVVLLVVPNRQRG